MADRGFSLSAEMREKGVKLNIAAFTRGRKQITKKEATESRRISRLRIHVERVIGRVKTYQILKQPLPIHHKKIMNRIILVCAALCNLKGALIAAQDPQERKRDQDDD